VVAAVPSAWAVSDEHETLTYDELDARANVVAAQLCSGGVQPGHAVGVYMDHSVALAVALLGTLKAGGACLPLDPAYPHERLAWMVADAGATALLKTSALDAPASSLQVIDVDLVGPEGGHGERPESEAGPESPAYIIYTSGSTGRPKGVLLPHRGLVNHQLTSAVLYGLRPDDVMLHLGSIGFDISIEALFPTWAAGGKVVFRSNDAPLSGSLFLADLERLGVSVLDLPTAFWHQWVTDLASINARVPSVVKTVIVGGERASSAALERWRQLGGGGSRWFNTYGPTEASVIATAWEAPPLPEPVPDDLPIGRPIDGVRVYLLGPDGATVAEGEPGELYIAGAGVALGYLNRPELTAEKFLPDTFFPGATMYRTGDVAQWHEGQLYFRDRVDDQVKIRGFRVEPGEIEAVLLAHPGVDQAVVVARPAPSGEKRLLGYVVARPGSTLDGSEILRLLPERLPLHLVPVAVTVLDSLPLTANGKVDKAALPDVVRAPRRVPTPPEPARDGIDRALIDIWEEVLGVAPVGIDDDFFAMGGHSLGALRMLAMIEWLMSVEVPMRALLEAPTVRNIADSARSGAFVAEPGLIQTVVAGGDLAPLIYICTVETGVVALRRVLPFLGPDRPVHAFVLRRTAGRSGIRSIEALAEAGLAEVQERFPSAAYSVVGYSIGGLVAYELADRLAASGARVELLGLLDTWSPDAPITPSAPPSAGSWARALRVAKRGVRSLPEPLRNRLATVAGAANRPGPSQPGPNQPGPNQPGPNQPGPNQPGPNQSKPAGGHPGMLLLDDGSLSSIYDSYRPPPYAGRVLLLSTQTSIDRFGGVWLGWHPVDPSNWRCALVPGVHGDIMFGSNAAVVGQEIAAALSGTSGTAGDVDAAMADD
jgi:amino acid adenylation domain-containing protein